MNTNHTMKLSKEKFETDFPPNSVNNKSKEAIYKTKNNSRFNFCSIVSLSTIKLLIANKRMTTRINNQVGKLKAKN